MPPATNVAGKQKHPGGCYPRPPSTVLGQDKPSPSSHWKPHQQTAVVNWIWVWQVAAQMLCSFGNWEAAAGKVWWQGVQRCQSVAKDSRNYSLLVANWAPAQVHRPRSWLLTYYYGWWVVWRRAWKHVRRWERREATELTCEVTKHLSKYPTNPLLASNAQRNWPTAAIFLCCWSIRQYEFLRSLQVALLIKEHLQQHSIALEHVDTILPNRFVREWLGVYAWPFWPYALFSFYQLLRGWVVIFSFFLLWSRCASGLVVTTYPTVVWLFLSFPLSNKINGP